MGIRNNFFEFPRKIKNGLSFERPFPVFKLILPDLRAAAAAQ